MNTDIDETIVDASKPNAGRIYDYFLGGNHNFEVDRQMAKEIEKKVPFGPKLARLVRVFLREGIRVSLEKGYTQFLDFASGLPTNDHIHSTAPGGTKVVYSDIDPVTVSLGRKIIGENPLVKYETCNAGEPEKLLDSDVVKELFGNNHKAAIGFNGICWFLSNEQIDHAMKVLYEWADKGSILYLTGCDLDTVTEEFQTVIDFYNGMNQFVGVRSKKELIELIKPWKLEKPGFLPIEEWIGISKLVLDETIRAWKGGGLYAGFLKK